MLTGKPVGHHLNPTGHPNLGIVEEKQGSMLGGSQFKSRHQCFKYRFRFTRQAHPSAEIKLFAPAVQGFPQRQVDLLLLSDILSNTKQIDWFSGFITHQECTLKNPA
jgi:hypothetical protein